MKKIKVLLCSPYLDTGGISRWTNNITGYFQEFIPQIDIRTFYPSKGDLSFNPPRNMLMRLLRGVRRYGLFIFQLKKEIKKESFDVAHFSTSGSISFIRDYLALRLCKANSIKTVLHLHFGRIPEVLKGNSLEKYLFLKCTKYADEIITLDLKTYQVLNSINLKSVSYLPNPISKQFVDTVSKHKDIKPIKNLVVYAGHVIPSKGITDLVKAASRIENVQLELVGPVLDSYKDVLFEIIKEKPNISLTFKGQCTSEEVIKNMLRSSIFVLPSHTEGFPNVIIEAMACGCAIISTNVGAIPEMLNSEEGNDNPCGKVIPPKDVDMLHTSMLEILSDNIQSEKMREAAFLRVHERYEIDKISQNLYKIWGR